VVLIDAKCLVFPQQRGFDIGAKFLVFLQKLRGFDWYEAKFVVSNATPTSKWIPTASSSGASISVAKQKQAS